MADHLKIVGDHTRPGEVNLTVRNSAKLFSIGIGSENFVISAKISPFSRIFSKNFLSEYQSLILPVLYSDIFFSFRYFGNIDYIGTPIGCAHLSNTDTK